MHTTDISRDGSICIWSQNLKLQRFFGNKDLYNQMAWVTDAIWMQEHNKLIIVTDNSRLCIYDILSLKPRLVLSISQLEHSPLCVTYTFEEDDDTDIVLFGDDGGYVNILYLKRKFFENMNDNSLLEQLTSAMLLKKKSDSKSSLANITFFRVSTLL